MNEREFKRIQKEARESEERTDRLEWELEEVIKELDTMGFNPPDEAYHYLEKLERGIARDEKKLAKLQRLYDKRWLGQIEEEED